MKISACIITKNEAKNIKKCLDSLRLVATEIVLVDTGSSDETIDIAKQYGARTHHFKWVDDFSEARNYAIDKAVGEWIIFLDADEYLLSETAQVIRTVIDKAEKQGSEAIIGVLTNYSKDTNSAINSFPAIRIFKNTPEIRYKGAIHEALQNSVHPLRQVDATKYIRIMHTGYSDSEIKIKDKSQRNLDLLFKELNKKPHDSNTCFYISEAYMLARNFEQALTYAYKCIENDNASFVGVMEKNYINIIEMMATLNYSRKDIIKQVRKAIQRFPEFPDFYFYLALYYEQENRLNDAIEAYQICIDSVGNALTSQSSVHLKLVRIFSSLGDLYYKTMQYHRCIESYVESLKTDKYNFVAAKNLIRILSKFEKQDEIISFMWKLYDDSLLKDKLFLLKVVLDIGNAYFAEVFYLNLTKSQQERLGGEYAQIQLLKGQYAIATKLFRTACLNNNRKETVLNYIVSAILTGENSFLEDVSWINDDSIKKVLRKIKGDNVEFVNDDKVNFLKILECFIFASHDGQIDKFRSLIIELGLIGPVAEVLYYKEKYPKALEYFNFYLEYEENISSERLADVLIKMGDSMYKLGNLSLAFQFFEDAIRINPLDYRAYELAISVSKDKGEGANAKNIARSALSQFPESRYMKLLMETN